MNFQPDPTLQWGDIRESQVYESSKLFGRKVYYIQSEVISNDEIFQENVSRKFLDDNTYEFYSFRDNDTFFDGSDGFGGFGFIPSYSDILYIPIKWFTDNNIEPKEGDLILYDKTQLSHLFEITKVDTKTEEYNGDVVNGRRFSYKIYLKLYEKADDNFNDVDFNINPETETLLDLVSDDLNDISKDLSDHVDDLQIASKDDPWGEL
jgi:hypothetical protein